MGRCDDRKCANGSCRKVFEFMDEVRRNRSSGFGFMEIGRVCGLISGSWFEEDWVKIVAIVFKDAKKGFIIL